MSQFCFREIDLIDRKELVVYLMLTLFWRYNHPAVILTDVEIDVWSVSTVSDLKWITEQTETWKNKRLLSLRGAAASSEQQHSVSHIVTNTTQKIFCLSSPSGDINSFFFFFGKLSCPLLIIVISAERLKDVTTSGIQKKKVSS